MSLTPSTQVKISLSALGAILLGIIALLTYVKTDTPTSNKESIPTPAIQNIQNNNNFSNPLNSTVSQNYQVQTPLSDNNATTLGYKNSKLEEQNVQLKNDISELLAKNTELQKYSDQQSHEISRLKKIIDSQQEIHNAIEKLNKENNEYLSKIQRGKSSDVFEPILTAEQKIDYRNAIAQNIEVIKGYQRQLKASSN